MKSSKTAKVIKCLGFNKVALWYLIVFSVVLGLSALGITSEDPPSYYNKMSHTSWWSPVNVLFVALFTLLIPVPNVLIACLFRTKRNLASILRIYRNWYIGIAVLSGVIGLIALSNRNSDDFCTSVLSADENKSFLKKFHENDIKFYNGNSIQYGKDTESYKAYSYCVNNNSEYKCWNELVNSSARTNREALEHELSVGVVLRECQINSMSHQKDLSALSDNNSLEKTNTRVMNSRLNSKSGSESDNILVIYTKSSGQFSDVIIGADAISALEIELRNGVLNNYAKLLKQKGFSSAAIPEVTDIRASSIESFGVPVGIASVWLKSATSEGEMRSKYIYVAGVIGDTMHKVYCSQMNGDDINLLTNKKCHNKLAEVFSQKK